MIPQLQAATPAVDDDGGRAQRSGGSRQQIGLGWATDSGVMEACGPDPFGVIGGQTSPMSCPNRGEMRWTDYPPRVAMQATSLIKARVTNLANHAD
jgi:hypothetical protein